MAVHRGWGSIMFDAEQPVGWTWMGSYDFYNHIKTWRYNISFPACPVLLFDAD